MDAVLAGLILAAIVIGPVSVVALVIGTLAIVNDKDDVAKLAVNMLGRVSMAFQKLKQK